MFAPFWIVNGDQRVFDGDIPEILNFQDFLCFLSFGRLRSLERPGETLPQGEWKFRCALDGCHL